MALNISDTISETFNRLKDTYLHNFKIGLVVLLLPLTFAYIILYSSFPSLAAVEANPSFGASIALAVVAILSVVFSLITLSAYLKGYVTQKPSDFSEGAYLAPKIFGVQITQSIVFLLVGFFALNLILSAIPLNIAESQSISAIVSAINWSLFIPGLLLAGLTALVYFICSIYWTVSLVEATRGKGVIESIKSSFHMVKGNWWATFGASLIFGIMAIIAGFVFSIASIPFALIQLVEPVTGAIVVEFVNLLFTVAILPVSTSFIVSLHEQLQKA